jgi:deoxyribonuclease-4
VWEKTKKEFDQVIGLDKIKIFHLNDCKRELGSKIDRHERIGKGLICLKGFANILNDKDFRNIPMILEIPGGDEAYAEDLKILRKLIK